jgi:hypothetical protein
MVWNINSNFETIMVMNINQAPILVFIIERKKEKNTFYLENDITFK